MTDRDWDMFFGGVSTGCLAMILTWIFCVEVLA